MDNTQLKYEWLNKILCCVEGSFIIDEKTKTIIWSNNPSCTGERCYKAIFDKNSVCENCPKLKKDELYSWDSYNDATKNWFKVKNILFTENGKEYRACNVNVMDDVMRLNYESLDQLSALQKLYNENKRIKNALQKEAEFDLMTGLFNRNRFNLDLSTAKFDCAGTGALYFDLNNLKEVNDKYRHEAGDRLIIALATAVSATAERFSGYAYRLGGDEFLLLFIDKTLEEIQKAHKFFDDYISTHPSEPPVIAAIGEVYSPEVCDVEELVSKADGEMYKDKLRLKGKNAR